LEGRSLTVREALDRYVGKGPRRWMVDGDVVISWSVERPRQKIGFRFARGRRHWTQTIKLSIAQLRYGERIFFVCPKTGRRCDRLYYWDGSLASAKGHRVPGLAVRRDAIERILARLEGSDGADPARGANRQRIIATLKSRLPKLEAGVKRRAENAVHEALEKRLRQIGYLSNPPRASTEWALQSGDKMQYAWLNGRSQYGASPYPVSMAEEATYDQIERAEQGSGADRFRPLASNVPVWFTEECRTLDIRVLTRAGHFGGNWSRSILLNWETNPEGAIYARINDALSLLALAACAGSFKQTIALEIDQRGRRAFICPITGRRSELLYYREGCFASRKAQRMVNRSQRVAHDPIPG
jgi:hypothetical protein